MRMGVGNLIDFFESHSNTYHTSAAHSCDRVNTLHSVNHRCSHQDSVAMECNSLVLSVWML